MVDMKESESKDLPIELKLVISAIAIIFLLLHLIYPNLKIDAISISLILLLLFPWIFEYMQKISLPGGGGFEKAQYTIASTEEIKVKEKEEADEIKEFEKEEIEAPLKEEKKEESMSEKIIQMSTDEFVRKIPIIEHDVVIRIFNLFFAAHSTFSREVKVSAGFESYIFDGILHIPEFGDVVVEIKIFKHPPKDFNKILTNVQRQIEFVQREMPNTKKYLLVVASNFSNNFQRRDLHDSLKDFKRKFGYGFFDMVMFDFDELYIDI